MSWREISRQSKGAPRNYVHVAVHDQVVGDLKKQIERLQAKKQGTREHDRSLLIELDHSLDIIKGLEFKIDQIRMKIEMIRDVYKSLDNLDSAQEKQSEIHI